MLHKAIFPVFAGLFILFSSLCYAQPKLILPIGHTGWVKDAVYSKDGKKVATVSIDKVGKIWDAETGSLVVDLKGHTGGIDAIRFSPDGKKVVTSSWDGTNRIWDTETGDQLLELKSHRSSARYAEFNKDGSQVLTYGTDEMQGGYKVKIWNAASGKLISVMEGHTSYLNTAEFSNDGTKVLTSSLDNTAKIWNASSGKLITDYTYHTEWVTSAKYSPDGNYVITTSKDRTARIWNTESKMLLAELKGHTAAVNSADFSPDGKLVVTASDDSTAKIWETATGKLLADLKGNNWKIDEAKFSPDGSKVITPFFKTIKTWDVATGRSLLELNENDVVQTAGFSPDGKKILGASWDYTSRIWDANTGRQIVQLKGHTAVVNTARFSPDGKQIVIASGDTTSRILDIQTGRVIASLKGNDGEMRSAKYSPDGQYILTTGKFDTYLVKLWNGKTGEFIRALKGHRNSIVAAHFSSDSKLILSGSEDSTARIWEVETGKLLFVLKGHKAKLWSAGFSPDGSKVVTAAYDETVKIWDARSGNLLFNLVGHTGGVPYAEFSADGTKVVSCGAWDGTARVWDAATGKEILTIKSENSVFTALFSPDGTKIVTSDNYGQKTEVWNANSGKLLFKLKWENGSEYGIRFSADGQKLITYTENKVAGIWNSANGKLITELKGHTDFVNYAEFSPDGTKIVTGSDDNTMRLWDAASGNLVYTFLTVDESESLLLDKEGRYDGTDAARKLLYYTCGSEIIKLDQVKDQFWVPNLAERILKGEVINAKKLSQLDICGLTPEVDDLTTNPGEYHFRIRPRKGGLGETVLFVNGIEARRFKPSELQNQGKDYDLVIKKSELESYFIAGKDNPVTVNAYIADNTVSSRGLKVVEDKSKSVSTPPNLYAVMVGISDYKGKSLDLKYAAKDAVDMSAALSMAAKKLLNTDGKEHVFMYNLTTANERYQLPEKNSIRNLLEEIGKKATANDILLIFFAGHGVMSGEAEKKQFYFLTADASDLTTGAVKDVGISTTELVEWMKPQHMKAQKRILIFDACNSGQAINDIAGKDLAVRNDDKAQQAKVIDKLNERSGLFILSASASNQAAYEMGRYSQGLLTYSLLKAIKQQPDILEDGKYLDVSRWFSAAEKTVTELSRENGARQEPQVISNTNFNIGIVDNEVMAKIILPQEKPLFAASNFQNSDEAADGDNLELSKLINLQLNALASRGSESAIVYVVASNSPDAITLSGRYDVKGDDIAIRVSIKKNNETKFRFEEKGSKQNLEALVTAVTTKAAAWAANGK